MHRPRILIASILKPVDDTRMLDKMATTLAGSGKYEVWIAGFPPAQSLTQVPDVHHFSLPFFSRLSLGRLLAPFKILQIARKVKPHILIVNTHELLIVGMLNRIFFGCRFVYDVRENYVRNILYSEVFHLPLRPILAAWVRIKEWVTYPFVDQYVLAEKGYEKEMGFLGRKAVVIENKAVRKMVREARVTTGETRLLFSGTLAQSTGVFDAIELAKKLHEKDPQIRLKIVGYAASLSTRLAIQKATVGLSFIELVGLDQLVAHPLILEAISNADFGLIAYPPSRHTEHTLPTKLYEYLSAQLPILMVRHPGWEALCNRYAAAIAFDWKSVRAEELLQQMQTPFYLIEPKEVTWPEEGVKLLEEMDKLISDLGSRISN